MASCQRIETGSNAGRDLISELPVDLKERILESLPTRDAARTAFLSTHWKDVWLRHGRLAFDWDFVRWLQECQGYDSTSVMNIINIILLLRVGPVKKFTLQICYSALAQTEIDKWCLFLSKKGVQELNMSCLCPTNLNYKLPFCIVLCQTIKHLKLQDFLIDLPVNGGCIFPRVTSLVFDRVLFKHTVKGNVFRIPKLEKLTSRECDGIQNFDISAPNLRSFSQLYTTLFPSVSIPRWFTAHLETIKYLCLSADLLETAELAKVAPTFPTARNLQVIKLCRFRFGCEEHLKLAKQLIEKSPNLCRLEIAETQEDWNDDKESPSKIFEGPDIIQELCFRHNAVALKTSSELLGFLSPKAQIGFLN